MAVFTALLAAGKQPVITTMSGHPVVVALAIARRIAKSSASTEVTRPAGTLIDAVWNSPTQHAATATACHWLVVGTLASVAHMT